MEETSSMRRLRRAQSRRLPNFLVIGAMKAGTTSLYHYLKEHPEIFMPAVKELDFFSERGNWHRGLDWYRKQFKSANDAIAIGESSATYSKHPIVPRVPERIAELLPDCRIVYVLRDPVERIRSHYQHQVALGSERAPIEEAVLRDPGYLTCSSYGQQVEQYARYFPRERLLLITSEDLRDDRQATVRRVYEFLGVDVDVIPRTLSHEYYRTVSRVTYSPHLATLRRALKKRLPATKRAKELVDVSLARVLGGVNNRHEPLGRSASASLPPHVREQLADALRDDVRVLRAYMPDGFDGWGLA
jgi:hypothetical protein